MEFSIAFVSSQGTGCCDSGKKPFPILHYDDKHHSLPNPHNQINKSTIKKCINTYGFNSDPNKPHWVNTSAALAATPIKEYFNRPSNNTYHNLCKKLLPPKNIGKTLGLGLKFCIQSTYPKNTIDKERFTSDVRKKFIFAGSDPLDEDDCPKKLVVKSKWKPDPQDDILEHKITNFTQTLDILHTTHLKQIRRGSNLSHLQKTHLKFLHKNKDFVVLMCDKNLGPAIHYGSKQGKIGK